MDNVIEFFKSFDFQNLLILVVVMWYFTRELEQKIEKKIDDMRDDISDIHRDLKTMNTRIGRLEGTTYGSKIYEIINEE